MTAAFLFIMWAGDPFSLDLERHIDPPHEIVLIEDYHEQYSEEPLEEPDESDQVQGR
jgi:hypothetical protein